MPNRPNPYFGGNFRHQPIADLFKDLTLLTKARREDAIPSQIAANQARADASAAAAALSRAKATGESNKNDAMASPASMLGQLFELSLQGKRFEDDPVSMRPDWKERLDSNLSVPRSLADPMPEYQPVTDSGMSAADRWAAVIQEARMRGIPLTDIAKFAGQGGYLGAVQRGDAETGRGHLPLFGQTPTARTALTTGRADQMRSEDAMDDFTKTIAKQDSINRTGIEREGMQQAGATRRNLDSIDGRAREGLFNRTERTERTQIQQAGALERAKLIQGTRLTIANNRVSTGGARPAAIPNIPVKTVQEVTAAIEKRAKEMGLTIESEAGDVLVVAATKLMQDEKGGAFKNPAAAVRQVMDQLREGELGGVERSSESRFFGLTSRDTVRRTPAGAAPAASPTQPAQPAPAQPTSQRPTPASIPGLPAGARIGAQTPQGWEVFDSTGKLIGHARE